MPNGTLIGDGVCARIKEELLKDFNLHTIVRLHNGVFAPYISIPTNLLFFDRSGPTKEVWYYEQPLPEGRNLRCLLRQDLKGPAWNPRTSPPKPSAKAGAVLGCVHEWCFLRPEGTDYTAWDVGTEPSTGRAPGE